MRVKSLLLMTTVAAILAGCDSGDIQIAPATSVSNSNNTTNTGGGGNTDANAVCASYVNSGGQTIRGTYDGTNCTYSPSFVDAGNNLKVDMTIPALPNGGAHVFQGSLFVGETYNTNAEMQAAGIAEGGDGPVLTIEAGATIAFPSEKQFIIVNRGSQLFAVGRADAPITFTSVSDVNGTVGAEQVQQWGGMVINGFGVTNQCAYTGTRGQPGFALAGECHVDAEGSEGLDESQYGGANDNDSSGRLEYVVVKHTGATVGNGDELNGISFGGVGRNTVIRNIQVYSTYDDGLEFFGGAVNIENVLAMYVRDDSLDMDEGYIGTISNALIIQSQTDGAHCIEADGIADFSNLAAPEIEDIIARGLNTRVTVNRMTCVYSPNGPSTATHEPGAGLRLREGLFIDINDSLLVGSFIPNDTTATNDNYAVRIDNRSQQAALDGDLNFNSVIIAAAERTRGQNLAGSGTFEEAFLTGEGVQFATVPSGSAVNPTATADAGLQLLEGTQPVFSIAWATSLVDNAAPAASTQPTSGTYLGAISLGDATYWATQDWAYGLNPDNRGQALYFE